MRAVTVHTEQIAFLAVPFACAPAVNPRAPVAIFLAVALAAYPVGFLERHPLAAGEVEEVAIVCVVTIETPPMLLVVLQHDVIVVFDDPSRAIRLQIRVTEGTRKDTLGERRRRHVDVMTGTLSRGRRGSLNWRRGSLGWRGVLRCTRLREEDSSCHQRQRQGRLHRLPLAGCVRSSTTRCISRSHIAWNTCSRCPMTSATFCVTM